MTQTAERVFDWHPRFDDESLDFKIAKVAPQWPGSATRQPRNKAWTRGAWLDQGQEGACIGFSFAQLLAATPKPRPETNTDGEHWYEIAQAHDEYPGKNYEGSSVLGAMQGGKAEGVLLSYWWATTLEEIDAGLSFFGPMQFGVPWMTGMMRPSSDGWLNVSGQQEGGHAICVAARAKLASGRVRYRIDNSWGKDWGINGSAYVDQDVLAFWLSHQSEFALPRKAKFALPRKAKVA